MDITIKTKFDISDIIYTPEIFDGEYYIDGPHKIKSIQLEIVNEGVLVKYCCENMYANIIESHCFASYDECEEWCLIHS